MSEARTDSGSTGVELEFPTLQEFVRDFLSSAYERQVADQHDTVWCVEWWRHPEAYMRLHALWKAYEQLRHDETVGLSNWWFDHADPHMGRLLDPRGPFKYCSTRQHQDVLSKLPAAQRAHGQSRYDTEQVMGEPGSRNFASLDDFVDGLVRVAYARQVRDVHDTVWCPQWWEHPEAKSRLTAMWHAYEHLRQGDATGMSVWWLDHADKHMARLFDPSGTFKYCNVRDGHKDVIRPLPGSDSAPMDLFVEPTKDRLEQRAGQVRGG